MSEYVLEGTRVSGRFDVWANGVRVGFVERRAARNWVAQRGRFVRVASSRDAAALLLVRWARANCRI